jgi:ABC-type antimicrobial peptide transport system permease subunit
MRQKEFALRVLCGASSISLMKMLTVEFIIIFIFAGMLGFAITQLLYKQFLELSNIQISLSEIYSETFVYFIAIVIVSLLVYWILLFIFQRRSLNKSIHNNKNTSRKILVLIQLIISISFAFCTIVILKQMHFLLHNDDLGFSFRNTASLMITGEESEIFAGKLRQIPEVTEVVHTRGMRDILQEGGRMSFTVTSWDGILPDTENVGFELMYISSDYANFYDFQLLAGEMLNETDPDNTVIINDKALAVFAWEDDPIGKQFSEAFGLKFTVKGVIKHVYNFSPTIAAKPVIYQIPTGDILNFLNNSPRRLILFRYHEGMWLSCLKKIEAMKSEFEIDDITNAEEKYEKYLSSERNLTKLLSFVSSICILICIFGFVSIIILSCEEKRKAIAIHKINGAKAIDIVDMFAKEYALLFIIGTIIAFTIGYCIMQRWLENYIKQTSIPLWIYTLIICTLVSVIVLCVGWRVYRSSIENPADVIS